MPGWPVARAAVGLMGGDIASHLRGPADAVMGAGSTGGRGSPIGVDVTEDPSDIVGSSPS